MSPTEQFISEPITPIAGTASAARMSIGEPGVPEQFLWRGSLYRIDKVDSSWKTLSGCRHGSDEQYVRRHWYYIRTQDKTEWKIYCDRQAPRGRSPKQRWWVYSRLTPHHRRRSPR